MAKVMWKWMDEIDMYTLMRNEVEIKIKMHTIEREETEEGGRVGRGEDCLPMAHCF